MGTTTAAVKGKAKGKAAAPAQALRIEVMKAELVDEHLAKHKLETGGDLEAKATRLQEHYRRTAPEDKVTECDNCGADSDMREPVCPFCGAEGIEEEPKAKGGDIVPEAPAAASAGAQAGPWARAVEAAKAKGGKPADGKPAEGGKSDGKSDGKPAEAAKAKGGKPAASVPAPVTEQKLVAVKGKGKTAAPVSAPVTEIVATERDLDEAVARVRKAKAAVVIAGWELGREILDIYERKLHLQRRGDDGQPKYKTWTQFCAAELGFTAGYSYKVMDVSAAFTREDVEAVGVAKLGVMLKLPPAVREEMKERAKREGLPYSKVAAEVHRLAGGAAGQQRRDTGRTGFRGKPGKGQAAESAKAKKAAKKPAKDASSGQVTVALVTGRVKVPLFSRGKPDARAKRLADDPGGVEELANNVERVYRIATDPKGGLVLIVETRRKTA